MYYWSFVGMHFFWWLFWVGLMVALFSLATPVPRRRMRLYEHPLAVLQRRYAAGEITTEDYEERKSRIEKDGRFLELGPPKDVRTDRREVDRRSTT
jgi:putative membrane protein